MCLLAERFRERILPMHSATKLGIIGDFNQQQKSHQAIEQALAAVSDGGKVEWTWVSTDSVGNGENLAEFDGIWCAPGMPYRNPDGALRAIRHARERRTPFLGTSAGFQYSIIEFARNALGLAGADHQKSNPNCLVPVVSALDAALVGLRARVKFRQGTAIYRAYQAPESVEEYRCSFGLNGRYRRLVEGPMTVSAVDDHNDVRAVELDGHAFFVATLFMPEMNPGSPLIRAFAAAACSRHALPLASKAS
jgi:CTP synthase (UTP-ammonia lyase)